jgi:hypothetical protein
MGVALVTTKLPVLLLVGSAIFFGAERQEEQKITPQRSIQDSVQQNLTRDVEDDEDGVRELFLVGDGAVAPLIKFLSDPDKEKRASAAKALAYIGNPQGVQALRNAIKSERDKETKSTMTFFLIGGLVATTSESDLNFLKKTIETARFADDGNPSDLLGFSAALTFGMMRRSDSLGLLRKLPKDSIEEIGKAIRWTESKSVPQLKTPVSASEEDLVRTYVLDGTFFAEEERDKTSVTELTFSSKRNKVLISLEIYQGPKSARGYDLVLSKMSGEWKVEGIWFAWIA